MPIFSKRTLRFIKTFLIISHTEISLLLARVISFYILFYQGTLSDLNDNQVNLMKSDKFHRNFAFTPNFSSIIDQLFIKINKENQFYGGIRLVQYQLCDHSFDCEQNTIDFKNETLCFNEDCSEFNKRRLFTLDDSNLVNSNPKNFIWTSYYSNLPSLAYFMDIEFADKQQFQEKINLLKQNNWFLPQPINIWVLQANILNIPTNILYHHSVILSNHMVTNNVNLQNMNQFNVLEFSIIFLISIFLFFLKIIFEGSVYPKPTQIPIIINLLVECTYVSLCLIEITTMEGIKNSQTIYKVIDPILTINEIKISFQGLCFFFMPFNLFWLFTYVNGTQVFVQYANMVYKTLFPMSQILLVLSLLTVCWACGFYIGFRESFKEFKTYELSLYGLIMNTIPNSWYNDLQSNDIYIGALMIQIFFLCRYILFGCIFFLVIIQVQYSCDLLFDFRSENQIKNLTVLNIMQKKIDKFVKTYLSDNDIRKTEQSKVVAWLNQDLYTAEELINLEEECLKNDIKLQCFGSIVDLIQFLKFLFQIKPQLLFKSSVYFRIIVDLEYFDSPFEYLQRESKINEYQSIAHLLYMLKDKGSRVPLLLNYNSDSQPQEGIIRFFYKVVNFDELKDFIMNESLKRWQKKTIIKEEEELENEDEESEVIEQEE